MLAFEYRFTIALEETNLLGNVYFANYVRWQGRCRELFLKQEAPALLPRIGKPLHLVTTQCSCRYVAELAAFDDVLVRMKLGEIFHNKISLLFDYFKDGQPLGLVARGEQEIACLEHRQDHLKPVPVPEVLLRALEPYRRPQQDRLDSADWMLTS